MPWHSHLISAQKTVATQCKHYHSTEWTLLVVINPIAKAQEAPTLPIIIIIIIISASIATTITLEAVVLTIKRHMHSLNADYENKMLICR